MLEERSSRVIRRGIVILIVVVSLFFAANYAFATMPLCSCVEWDKHAYKLGETATFTLETIPVDIDPLSIDFTYVHLSSDSDKIGSDYLVAEIGKNTASFFGEVQFGTYTDGTTLKTNVGDSVYIEFGYLSDSAKILPSLDDKSSTVKYVVVTTDKASYSVGETVRITGEVRDLYPNGILKISSFYPNGAYSTIDSQEVVIDADKKFILTHTAGGEQKAGGPNIVTARYWQNSSSPFVSGETSFDVSCLNALSCYDLPLINTPQYIAKRQAQQMLLILVVAGIGIGIGTGVFVIKRRK